MRLVYLANNALGRDVLRWLVERGDRPVGLVVHPKERARYREEIIEIAGLGTDHVIEAPALRTAEGAAWLRAHQPDRMLSVMYAYILKADALTVPRHGTLNLHPALLPWNRGAYPNVWSIVERTPSGATLHYVDSPSSVDTGDIVAQREVMVLPEDTGATLYARLERAALEMFTETWPRVTAGVAPRRPQTGTATFHRSSDVEAIDRIDPDRMVRAGDLIDIIRARTFAPYRGAYLDVGGRRIYLRLELEAAEGEP